MSSACGSQTKAVPPNEGGRMGCKKDAKIFVTLFMTEKTIHLEPFASSRAADAASAKAIRKLSNRKSK